MSTAVSASMQAALLIREKQRLRRKGKRPNRPQQLPSHVATREIAPFPRYPPYFPLHGQPPPGRTTWVCITQNFILFILFSKIYLKILIILEVF